MQEEVKRNFPIAAEFLLHMAGQQVTDIRPLVETTGTTFSMQLKVAYRKEPKTRK
jgi:hypothetical protein